MAGTAGLEPANAGIKTPCLNQLGHVPIVLKILLITTKLTSCLTNVIYLLRLRRGHYIGILIRLLL